MSEDTVPMPAHTPVGEPESASPAERARDLRAALGLRRQAETLLAEATEARMSAVAEADRTMAEAEVLAAELVDDARREADAIVARARAEADAARRALEEERAALREEVLAELDADVERQTRRVASLLDTTASDLQGLTPTLESALTVVAGARVALESLRSECGSGQGAPDPAPGPAPGLEPAPEPVLSAAPPRTASLAARVAPAEPAEPAEPADTADTADTASSDPAAGPDEAPRPLGWLFRAQRG